MNRKNRTLFTDRNRITARRRIIVLGFLLLLLVWGYAQADAYSFSQSSSRHEALVPPPALNPAMQTKNQKNVAAQADGIYAIYLADRMVSPQKDLPAVSANRASERSWTLAVEGMRSPVREAHGNTERLESFGGLVKGNIRF